MQNFDTRYNLIKILKHLGDVLLSKGDDAASKAGMQYVQIKRSFPDLVGEFFFPGSIFNESSCKMYAFGVLSAQRTRLECFLQPSAACKRYTEEEFEVEFNKLLEEMQKKYPISQTSVL